MGKGKKNECLVEDGSHETALSTEDSGDYIAKSRGVKYGSSIREKKEIGGPYNYPRDVHLIYIGMNGASLIARHMRRFNINYADIAAIEEELVKEAQKPMPPRVGQYGQDFARLEFQRASYLTMVVDAPGWEFYYPLPHLEDPVPGELHDPLVFIEKKQPGQNPAARNYAFYNCTPVSPRGCNGFRCINFFTVDAGGSPILTVLDYKFEIYLTVPFSPVFTPLAPVEMELTAKDAAGRLTTGRRMTIILDPDGQNQGP